MIDVLVIGGIFREVLNGDTKPRTRYGGSGLVSAIAAARIGARVALASYVGIEDEEAVRAELSMSGVDMSLVMTVPGASGTFVFPTTQDEVRPWPMYRPAEATPIEYPGHLPEASIVLLFGIPDFDPVHAGWLSTLPVGATVIWDKQGWISRARGSEAVTRLPNSRKIYLANEREAFEDALVDGVGAPERSLPPAGFSLAVIKRGIVGVVVIERVEGTTRAESIPSFPVAVESTIGSGDVFAGVFSARLCMGDSPPGAARWGCAAASVALRSGIPILGADALSAMDQLLVRQ